jgi:O-antigen ligase
MENRPESGFRAAPAGHALPYLLIAWAVAVVFSTAIAEILLISSLAVALWARREPDRSVSWAEGWATLTRGGPATRWIPTLWLAFLGWYLVSVAFGVAPAAALESTPKLVRYGLFFMPLVVPFSGRHWRVFLWAQVLLSLVLLAPALEVVAGDVHRASTGRLHYNTLAQLTAAISLLLLAAALFGPARARKERLAFLFGSALAAGIMLATLSRAAWLGWWLGVVLLLLFRLPRRVSLVVLAVLVLAPLLAIPTLQQRRADLVDLNHPEFTRRYDLWRMALDVVNDHPLTGVGPNGFARVYDDYRTGVLVDDERVWITSHNDTLTVAVRHGWPGAVLWVAIGITGVVAFVRRMLGFRNSQGSWSIAGLAGTGACLQLFALFGLLHDNYDIWLKINLLLLLWGLFVSADLGLARRNGAGRVRTTG